MVPVEVVVVVACLAAPLPCFVIAATVVAGARPEDVAVLQVRTDRRHGDRDRVEGLLLRAGAVADGDLAAGGRGQAGRGAVAETAATGDRHRREPSGGEKRDDGDRCGKTAHVESLRLLGGDSFSARSGGDVITRLGPVAGAPVRVLYLG